jgi:hypothetical protein
MSTRPAIAAAGCAVAAIAACGGSHRQPARPTVSGSERGVLETMDALQRASRAGDGQAICGGIFTARLVRSVEAAAKRSCAKEVRQRLFSPAEQISVSRRIKVNGNAATALIREQNGHASTVFMLRQGGRWRIDRVVPARAQGQ